MKLSYTVLTAVFIGFGTYSAKATITLYAEYHLGESGSLGIENRPQDSSGNGRHFADELDGELTTVGTVDVAATGSTAYLSTVDSARQGFFSSGLFSSLPVDNFAFGIFANAAGNTGATDGDIFTLAGGSQAFKISLTTEGWAASSANVGWIGGDDGVDGSFTANTWFHLALIRAAGSTTFYINGAAQGASFAGAPIHGEAHMSVSPGGNDWFNGLIDEARVVTFTEGESTTNVLNALQVPEPSAILLGGLGMLGLLLRRRK